MERRKTMLKLRIWLGVLIWWLFLFYNVERINEPINIASFVYVLTPVAAGALILLPRVFGRVSVAFAILPTLVVYFALKVLLRYPIFNSALPVTITEVVSISITLLLVKQVGTIVWDFEDTIAKLTFRQIGLPPRLYETTDTEDLYREVKRSRRFRHPLTLLVVRPDFDPAKVELNRVLLELRESMAPRYVQARLAKLFSEELRDSDLLVVEEDEFIILLPETTEVEAERMATRLQRQVATELDIDLQVGMAGFPDRAVTLRGLVDAATDALMGRAPASQGMPQEVSPAGSGDGAARG
jgi:GGDEF domain-containing protein